MIKLDVWGNSIYYYYPLFWGGRSPGDSFAHLQSLYVKETEAAIAVFLVNLTERKIIPTKLWRSPNKHFDIVEAAKKNLDEHVNSYRQVETIINPDATSTADQKKNILCKIFHEEQIYPSVKDDFEPIQGLAMLWRRQSLDQMDYSKFSEWPKIQAEIEQVKSYQSSALMAFLQGIIKCQLYAYSYGWGYRH